MEFRPVSMRLGNFVYHFYRFDRIDISNTVNYKTLVLYVGSRNHYCTTLHGRRKYVRVKIRQKDHETLA